MAVADSAMAPGPSGAGLLETLAQPWRELNRLPPLSWLAPQPTVRLLQADGTESLWQGDQRLPASGSGARRAAFVAVEVPADEHLVLALNLPPMSDADRRAALELQVRMASPFEASDLVWGQRPVDEDGTSVEVVMASRRAVQARIDGRLAQADVRGMVEAWALDDTGRPVPLQGFGEALRLARSTRGRAWGWLLIAMAALLGSALALTPTVQLKLRALQAERAYAALERELGPVMAQREALVKAQAQRDALRDLIAERIEPLAVLDLLTQSVPDDTWLQRLQVQSGKAVLTGITPNTAALMNRLSSDARLRDVRSPGAAQRAAGGRENFTIELIVAPEMLRPPAPAVVAPLAAPSVAAPASASVTGPVTPAVPQPTAAMATPPAPEVAPAAPPAATVVPASPAPAAAAASGARRLFGGVGG